MEKMSNRAGKREKGQAYAHIYSLYTSPAEPKKSLHFLSHSLLIEIMYHDCSVICFLWLAGPVSLCSI